MRLDTLQVLVTALGVAAAGSLLLAGCPLEVLEVPATTTGGQGGVGGAGGAAGSAGGQQAGRGDPADFPSSCLATCEEACDALDACDGASSSLFPLDREQCVARCGLAENGPVWDDQSGHFKCCASQTSCAAVQHCGGWLDHPAADASCDKVCNCFFSGAVAELYSGYEAPAGYRFAPDLVTIALDDTQASLPTLPGTRLTRAGRYARLELTARADDAATLAALAQRGTLLPTFTDRAGHISAATGRIVVDAGDEATRKRAAAIGAAHAFTAPTRLRYAAQLYLLEGHDGWRALAALKALRAAGIDAELDMLRQLERRYLPNDPLFGDQWHLLNTGQGEATVGVDARVSEAWDLTLGDPQVIIAINDDGVDLDHPDFAGKLEPELNYPSDWQTLMGQGLFGGHGSSVAGVAAALADNNAGGAGACPGCRLLPHRLGESTFLGFQVTDVEIADGFTAQVDAGAWVINNSWGIGLGDPAYVDATLPLPPLPAVVKSAFDYAESSGRAGKGTVIVYAAGNHNQELDYYATHPTTVAVAAVGDVGLKSYYSAFGPEVTIAAPSNGGLGGITTTAANGGYTDSFGGTSSASPLISGIVGLMLSANPALTAAEVRNLLAASATKIDPVFGAYQNGHSVYYGAGLVNAYVAVQMATGNCTDPATCPAPSDDCGVGCGSKTMCDSCRTEADCAADHVCQALPSLGQMICVPAVGGGCPPGTAEAGGYCLPTPTTCSLCGGSEECNGRDDDCNGEVDEGACSGEALCFIDGPGCGSGKACAGRRCTDTCNDAGDCAEGYQCKVLKDEYGGTGAGKGCVADQASQCEIGCSVLVSSTDDTLMGDFVACMQDGAADCSTALGCVQMLPINM